MDKNRNYSATNLSNITTANYIQNFIHSSSHTAHINGNDLDFDITDQLLIRYFTFVRDWRKNWNTTNFRLERNPVHLGQNILFSFNLVCV
jgi:hypothetical protein